MNNGYDKPLGEALLEHCREWFGWWHRRMDRTMQRTTFQWRICEVKGEVMRLLGEAAKCSSERTAGMAREILKLKKALFTFLGVKGLEPTNDAAERTLQSAMI